VGSDRHDAAFIVGAVLGAVVGGTAALFRVPLPGARVRTQLSERREAITTQLANLSSGAEGSARQMLAHADEQATAVKERIAGRTYRCGRDRRGDRGGTRSPRERLSHCGSLISPDGAANGRQSPASALAVRSRDEASASRAQQITGSR